MLIFQKTNKKGKKIGKPMLTGYQFTFNMGMNSSYHQQEQLPGADLRPGHCEEGKEKDEGSPALQPIGFSLKSISNNTVRVLLAGKQAFKYGGQIMLVATPPAESAARPGLSSMPTTPSITSPKRGSGITPA